MLKKNVASQTVRVFAKDTSAKIGKTGDAANITINISLDGGATSPSSNSVSEVGGGLYSLELTQAETNADEVALIGSSTTANVVLDVRVIATTMGILPTADAGGNGGLGTVDANNYVAGIPGTINDFDGLLAAVADTDDIRAEMDAGLAAIHLDHLLGAAYDPASKPGEATALFNVLVENDGGTPRYTANALEQGPGGGDATAANQATMQASLDTLTTRVPQTLNVTASGNIGVDLANIENPTSVVGLTNTTIGTCTTNTDMVSEPLDAAGIRTAVGLASANLDTQIAGLPDDLYGDARYPKYAAIVELDASGLTDDYTVKFLENGEPITSGITVPTITVTQRSDGSTLVDGESLTAISDGWYKYTKSPANLTAGDTAMIDVSATYDGGTITGQRLVVKYE